MSLFASLFIGLVAIWNRKSIKHRERLHKLEKERNEQMLNASISGQEKERSRIANDLHDDLGPLLSALKLQLNTSKEDLDIDTIQYTLNETVQNLRSVSSRMSPVVLEQLGLNKAVLDVSARFKQYSEINIEVDWDDEIENYIDERTSLNVYRIIQESLNNIIKHAEASKAWIIGEVMDNKIIIRIKDDGKGFEYSCLPGEMGLGINSMKARSEVIHASLEINTQPSGTEVVLTYEI